MLLLRQTLITEMGSKLDYLCYELDSKQQTIDKLTREKRELEEREAAG